ncbi:MAG: serine hydrolase [Acidobacteria bacterium]|nr:serine hydrolase [Acidobacteriota bacterium]
MYRLARFAFILAFPALLPAAVADNPDVQGAIRLFDAWMKGQMVFGGFPGVAVGVVHDQQLVWSKGYGYANTAAKTPLTAQTKFRMASHSKLFTATAIMQLREAGKLRLDDPITKYLPGIAITPADPDDPAITIEELLTHASGLPREAGSHWVDYRFPDAAEVKQYLATHRAPYSPEVRWKYSNLALTLAGMIVENVSGERYNAYIDRHIFAPLGMKDSSFDQQVPGLATGYGRRMPNGSRATMPYIDAKAMGPATGLTSTVEDMARFVSLQLRTGRTGGAQILNTGSLREMHRVRRLENDWTRGNAIGFAVNRMKDKLYVGHGGSYPGYKTHTYIQLDSKVGVIVLTNGDDSGPAEIAMRLMDTVGDAVGKAGATPKKTIPWEASWSRFAGHYSSASGELEVVELNQRLVMIDPQAETLSATQRLEPLGNGLFRLEAPAGGAPVGETVRFIEQGGKVTRIYVGDSYRERVQ